jgi:hypothetical protein
VRKRSIVARSGSAGSGVRSSASDSDKFVVLAADAQHAEVVLDGAIDSEEVRQEVIKLLEGGEPTYFLKQRKYNIRDPYGR